MAKEFLANDYNVIRIGATETIVARKQYATGRYFACLPTTPTRPDIRVQFGEGAPDRDKAIKIFPGDSYEFEEQITAFYIWISPNPDVEPQDQAIFLVGNREIKFNPSPQVIAQLNDGSLRNDFFGAGLNSLAAAQAFFDNPKYKFNGGNSERLVFAVNKAGYPARQSFLGGGTSAGGLIDTFDKQNSPPIPATEQLFGGLYKAYLVRYGGPEADRFIKYSDEPGGYGEGTLLWMEMDLRGNADEIVWLLGWTLFNNPEQEPTAGVEPGNVINDANAAPAAQLISNFIAIPTDIFQKTMSNVFHQGSFVNPQLAYKKNIISFVARDPSDQETNQSIQTFPFSTPQNKIELAFIDGIGNARQANGPTLCINLLAYWYGFMFAPSGIIKAQQRFFDTKITAYVANEQYIQNYFNDISPTD